MSKLIQVFFFFFFFQTVDAKRQILVVSERVIRKDSFKMHLVCKTIGEAVKESPPCQTL